MKNKINSLLLVFIDPLDKLSKKINSLYYWFSIIVNSNCKINDIIISSINQINSLTIFIKTN